MASPQVTTAGSDDQVVVVRAPAQLTQDTAHDLRLLIAGHLPNRDDGGLVIDMAEVLLVSSVGITSLLEVRELCDDRRIGLRLCGLIEPIEQLLHMLRLTEKFICAADVDEAVGQLVARR